jgi:hypothetical protein
MITVKETNQGNDKKGKLFRFILYMQFAILIPIIAFILWSLIEINYQKPELPQNKLTKTLNRVVNDLSNYRFPLLRVLGFNEDFESLYIDIKHKDYSKLEKVAEHDLNVVDGGVYADRVRSLRKSIYVPAKLRVDNENIKVNIRLKGDRKAHWADSNRWSFRIKVKGNNTLFGMRKFSVQHPATRNYIYEWIFHKMLKNEGLIGLRYKFINLFVNGKNMGPYVVEEHFDKFLIENNNRRDGPILKFNEDSLNDIDIWKGMSISAYQRKKWEKKNSKLLYQAITRLENFQSGKLKMDDIFDTKKMATYFAICDILETLHGAVPKSVKFYFNPVSKLFEPIGFDGHFLDKQYPVLVSELGNFRGDGGFWNYGRWFDAFFKLNDSDNIEFFREYITELSRISNQTYMESFFEKIHNELELNLDFIYSGIPFSDLFTMHPSTGISPLFSFDKNKIINRIDYISEKLKLYRPFIVSEISIFEDNIKIKIANRKTFPLKIIGLKAGENIYKNQTDFFVNGSYGYSYVTINFDIVKKIDTKQDKLEIIYTLPGSNIKSTQKIASPNVKKINRRIGDFNDFRFIKKEGDVFTIKKGDWKIDKTVVFPEESTLLVMPGVKLDILKGSRIISYGDIKLLGNNDDRIIIKSSDNTGKGIVVFNSSNSKIISTDIIGLYQPLDDEWPLSSILTFYESNISISNSKFIDNKSEDVINIVRGRFKINDSLISGTDSDAIDSDFSSGTISNVVFENIGNDAIDVSGSDVKVNNVTMNNVGDKGLSVGEGSNINASQITISNARIAYASKDSSKLILSDSSIHNVDIGFVVFQKKPEFSHAVIDSWRHVSSNVNKEYLVELGSTLILDGVKVDNKSLSLRKELY